MKKYLFVVLLFILIIFSQKSAEAIGVGVYLEGGGGSANYSYAGTYEEPKPQNYNNNMGFVGGGIVFDTALSTNTIFNYRAEIGYAWKKNLSFRLPVTAGVIITDYDLNEIKMVNSFGFGLYRTNLVRFWLGPQFNLLVNWGEKTATIPVVGTALFNKSVGTFSFTGGGFALGVVLGLNINFTGFVSLAFEAGFRGNFVFGGLDSYGTLYLNTTKYYSGGTSPFSILLTAEGFATIGVIFRINEKFVK